MAATITCAPMVAITLTYSYMVVMFALSFLLAVLAVVCLFLITNRYLAVASGTVCTALSLSIYQANIGAVLALFAGYLMVRAIHEPPPFVELLGKAARALATGILGVLLYYLAFILVKLGTGIETADYSGANNVSVGRIIAKIGHRVGYAYTAFWQFFAGDAIAANQYGVKYVYGALAIAAVVCLAVGLTQLGANRVQYVAMVVVLVGVYPLLANIIVVLTPDVHFSLLMVSGMWITVPLGIALIAKQVERLRVPARPRLSWSVRSVPIVLAALLLWSYALINQNDSTLMQMTQNETVALANRIQTRLEENPDYRTGHTPLLIAGTVPADKNTFISPLARKANLYAGWGTVWESYHGNLEVWQQIFRLHLGIWHTSATLEQFQKISHADTFKRMPLYPDPGSMKIVDGVMVVKLSEMQWD